MYSVPAKEMLHIEVGLFKICIVSVLSICLLCSASSWMCQNIYSSLPYSKLLHNNIQQCFTFLKNTKRLDLKRRRLGQWVIHFIIILSTTELSEFQHLHSYINFWFLFVVVFLLLFFCMGCYMHPSCIMIHRKLWIEKQSFKKINIVKCYFKYKDFTKHYVITDVSKHTFSHMFYVWSWQGGLTIALSTKSASCSVYELWESHTSINSIRFP